MTDYKSRTPVRLNDGTDNANNAAIKSTAPASDDFGVVVRPTPTSLAGVALSTVVTVGVTAVPLPANPLTGRRSVLVQADAANTADIYLGGSAVTADAAATGGVILKAGHSVALDLGSAQIYARSTLAAQVVRVLEAS